MLLCASVVKAILYRGYFAEQNAILLSDGFAEAEKNTDAGQQEQVQKGVHVSDSC